jgi:hypothetical protein
VVAATSNENQVNILLTSLAGSSTANRGMVRWQ